MYCIRIEIVLETNVIQNLIECLCYTRNILLLLGHYIDVKNQGPTKEDDVLYEL